MSLRYTAPVARRGVDGWGSWGDWTSICIQTRGVAMWLSPVPIRDVEKE